MGLAANTRMTTLYEVRNDPTERTSKLTEMPDNDWTYYEVPIGKL